MNLRLFKLQLLITGSLITLVCLIFFEAPPRIRKFYLNRVLKFEKEICRDLTIQNINFEYGSCPNIKYFRDGDPRDKNLNFIVSYTDSIGGRVNKFSKGKKFDKNDYRFFLIGDSFIQADELPYEETVYGIINSNDQFKEKKAYGFGMGSWHTKEYLQSIKAINSSKSQYDIYLFANDFTPHDHRPRRAYSPKKLERNPIQTTKKVKINLKDFLNFLAKKTYTFKRIKKIYYSRKFDKLYSGRSLTLLSEKNIKSSCNFLKDYENDLPKYMYDYIVFSAPYRCWTKTHKDTYQLVLGDIEEMISEVKKLDSKIRFIYIPPGFSFKGEFYPGRNHTNYGPGVPIDQYLKLSGLIEQLKSDIGNLLINLEDPIEISLAKFKKDNNCEKINCDNIFYFANDGHLNKRGHLFLYEFLYDDKK